MKNEFKAGIWVYVIDDTGQDSAIPEEHRLTKGESRLVEDVSPHGYLRVYGSPAYWIPQRFAVEKPRVSAVPTFEVGQEVSGSDYALLPVGTTVEVPEIGIRFTKTAQNEWKRPDNPNKHTDKVMSRAVRVIVSLPEPRLKEGQTVLVYARFTGYGPETIAGPGGTPTVEIPVADGLFKTVRHVDPDAVRPTEEVPPWTKVEPGGRYAIVRSGPIQHSRHNAAGGWLGTDGEWRTWEQVCKMATRANDPKTLVTDEEKTDG